MRYTLKLLAVLGLCHFSNCLSQEPTTEAKEKFDDFVAEFMLNENAMVRYGVKFDVIASSSSKAGPEHVETSVGFLAVDKEKRFVRYDYREDSFDENGSEKRVQFRHLQRKFEFYFGNGPDEFTYGVSKLERNMMNHEYGRMVNPMLLPFSGMMASKKAHGRESVLGHDLVDPEYLRSAWRVDNNIAGCIEGKQFGSRVFTFDPNGCVVKCEGYIHRKEDFVEVPSKKFRCVIATKTKWKELPKLGWRPVEAEDSSKQGTAEDFYRDHIVSKVTWLTDDFPDDVFEAKDMQKHFGELTTLQKLFEVVPK
jgi:hypothetical protein